MRLSRECDAAEDGRVAIFSNARGKRRLVKLADYVALLDSFDTNVRSLAQSIS